MGKADTVTKAYMRKNEVFADAFNYLIYGGRMCIDPAQLQEVDTTEIALPFGSQDEDGNRGEDAVQKYRDILKSAVVKQEDEAAYILLGIENQTDIHYAMADIATKHRKSGDNSKGHAKGEYLSGFYKEDRLKPVITLVVHFGADEWNAPLSLHEMMEVKNKELLNFVQDYQIHLIDPAKLTDNDLIKFSSSLREILECIKYSRDKEKFASFLKNNPRMVFDREAALVFKAITNTPIDIPEGLEEIDVCKAVEEMILESTEKGIGIGEMRMLVKQVRKGRLTVEEAAEDAGMTVEKFKEAMENTPSQTV